MGKGGLNLGEGCVEEYTREEVKKHCVKGDRWIIIDGIVYDVSRWAKRHPGGERIMSNHAGEDATVLKLFKQLNIRIIIISICWPGHIQVATKA